MSKKNVKPSIMSTTYFAGPGGVSAATLVSSQVYGQKDPGSEVVWGIIIFLFLLGLIGLGIYLWQQWQAQNKAGDMEKAYATCAAHRQANGTN